MKRIKYHRGDISLVPANALITAINSSGSWHGGIDGVIDRCAGELFHEQAKLASPLSHGQTIIARAGRHHHHGAFRNVVFVVDNLCGKLRDVIFNGLKAAIYDAGFTSVTIPAIRMGVLRGIVEKPQKKQPSKLSLV